MQSMDANSSNLFDALPDLLFVLDRNGNIVTVNDAVTRRLGYARKELIGNSILMFHPEERRDEAAEIVLRMMRGQEEHCLIPVQSKDGMSIPVETRVVPGRWDDQDVLLGVCRDISAVKLSEEKFSKTFHATSAIMAISTLEEGRFIEVNDAFLKVLGFSREEVIGKTAADLNIFSDPSHRSGALMDLVGRGSLRDYELSLRDKNGKLRYGLFSVETLYIQDSLCLLTTMIDTTERKRMEEDLRHSQDRWKFALEGAGDGVWDWDAATNQVHYSTQWKAMLGYSDDEISGTLDEWDRRIHHDDRAAAYADLERHFRGETEIYQNEHRMLCNDGSYKWILDRGKVIEWTENGKPRRVIGTHTDITERKRVQEELTRHRNRLEELVRERTEDLENKAQALQELNAALKVLLQQRDGDRKELEDRYVSNIKNLILPYVEKLKKTRLDDRQASYLGILETHLDEITAPLMKNLQQFNLTPTEVHVASLIKDGKSSKDIAEIMMVSAGTIDNHRKNIRKKLGLNKAKANLQSKLASIG